MTTTNPGSAVTMRIGGVDVPLVAMLERPKIERVTAEPALQALADEAAAKVAPGLPPPVLTFEGPDMATRDGLILGVNLAAIKGFETHEARVRLDLAAHVWNGDPKEHDPKMVTTNGHDAFLMGFLADVLRAEAEEASS